MQITLPYGSQSISFSPEFKLNKDKVIVPNYISKLSDFEAILNKALENPIGSEPLPELLKKSNRIAILLDDITRPGPKKQVVTFLVRYLIKYGIKKSDILIMFATGLHRKHTYSEWEYMLGSKILSEFRVMDHDPDGEYRYFGETKRGTPVEINKLVADADITIGVSYLGIHDFAGYTGGAKIILPGVSSRRSVQINHVLSLDERSQPGVADGNPAREDMEEAAKLFGYDFSINIPLNYNEEPVGIYAGDFIKAHRQGIGQVDFMYKIKVDKKVDVIFVSAGGFPNDISLYHASRALVYCSNVIREGGTLVLISECKEGIGNSDTEEIIKKYDNNIEEITDHLRMHYTIGKWVGWKILSYAEKFDIIVVSDKIDKEIFTKTKIKISKNISKALEFVYKKHGKEFDYLIIPYGNVTLPII